MHCGARQRARSQDVSVYKIVGSMHSSVIYTQDCIRNKPSALSHSDVHLMTYDVQLPAMMCNYTFYTYKINALGGVHGVADMRRLAQNDGVGSCLRLKSGVASLFNTLI